MNPIEVLIFSLVAAVFVRSVYTLVYDQQGASALTSIATATTASPPADRAPASVSATPAFLNVDVNCNGSNDQETPAGKVRFVGSLCGADSTTEAGKLVKATVTNTANKFTATVFTDLTGGKFSTDYMPLNVGKNPIHLEFAYRDGKTVSKDVTIQKN